MGCVVVGGDSVDGVGGVSVDGVGETDSVGDVCGDLVNGVVGPDAVDSTLLPWQPAKLASAATLKRNRRRV